jgi:hypothetical protein
MRAEVWTVGERAVRVRVRRSMVWVVVLAVWRAVRRAVRVRRLKTRWWRRRPTEARWPHNRWAVAGWRCRAVWRAIVWSMHAVRRRRPTEARWHSRWDGHARRWRRHTRAVEVCRGTGRRRPAAIGGVWHPRRRHPRVLWAEAWRRRPRYPRWWRRSVRVEARRRRGQPWHPGRGSRRRVAAVWRAVRVAMGTVRAAVWMRVGVRVWRRSSSRGTVETGRRRCSRAQDLPRIRPSRARSTGARRCSRWSGRARGAGPCGAFCGRAAAAAL